MPLDRLTAELDRLVARLDDQGTAKGREFVIREGVPADGERGPRYLLRGHGGRPFIRMNSNSYLGLALHPEVIRAEEAAARRLGTGPGAVRFIVGTHTPHVELEHALAAFHGREEGMIFSSAYAAVMGTLVPLIDPNTAVISDELNHNAIINAIRLSRPVTKSVYPYLDMAALDRQLAERDVTTSQRYLMQSNGGVMPFSAAIRGGRTHHTLLSGPAAGVVSAAFLCATQGFRNLVSLDIGGTSADVAFVEGGVPVEVTQGQIEGRTVYAPMVDVEAVSAGGGTIARVDAGGLLRVGPDSAGSDPGPACYGRGGKDATITDADMALGYLDPDYFLGGAMSLDPAAAERALMDGVGRPLGSRSPQEAAWGIVKVIEVKMADRILALASEKGISLREFSLVAGGGAGPLRSAGVAEELGIGRIIVPPRPGAFSALGLLCSDVVHDYVWTSVSELESTPVGELNRQFARLEQQALADVEEEGLPTRRARLKREADVRYVGQGFELRVPVRKGTLADGAKREIRRRFEARHQRLYGHSAPNEAVEIVSFRVRTVVPTPKMQTGRAAAAAQVRRSAAKPAGQRQMYFGGDAVAGAVYYRNGLSAGDRFDGPAVVYQEDSTTVVPPDWRAEVDGHANIIMTRR